MAKLTITVPDEIADAAKQVAEEQKTSVSALAARGLRDQVATAAAAAYAAWLSTDPELAGEVASWRAAADSERAGRWGSLGPVG